MADVILLADVSQVDQGLTLSAADLLSGILTGILPLSGASFQVKYRSSVHERISLISIQGDRLSSMTYHKRIVSRD